MSTSDQKTPPHFGANKNTLTAQVQERRKILYELYTLTMNSIEQTHSKEDRKQTDKYLEECGIDPCASKRYSHL